MPATVITVGMLSNRASRSHTMVETSLPLKRRAPRTPCRVTCNLILDGTSLKALMVDFSEKGFQVSSERMLPLGSPVVLELPRCAPVEASVRWALGSRAGCRFSEPVSREAISEAVEAPGCEKAEREAGR